MAQPGKLSKAQLYETNIMSAMYDLNGLIEAMGVDGVIKAVKVIEAVRTKHDMPKMPRIVKTQTLRDQIKKLDNKMSKVIMIKRQAA